MLNLQKKKIVFDPEQCFQCGSCLAVCPTMALSAHQERRAYRIVCDSGKCLLCGQCVRLCQKIHDSAADENTIRTVEQAEHIVLAHHRDRETRFLASSGGTVRAIVRGVLEQHLCDAVYTLVYPASGEEVEGRFLTSYPQSEEEIPCSLYRPVLWGTHLNAIDRSWKRILLVGLPCQIRSAKELLHHRVPGVEVWAVTIFCKKQKNFGYSRHVARLLHAPAAGYTQLAYRGQGWPGLLHRRHTSTSERHDSFYPAQCWNLTGCRTCLDSLNSKYSDLTVSDPWGIVKPSDCEAGQNLVFCWSGAGKKLLELPTLIMRDDVPAKMAGASLSLDAIREKSQALESHPWYDGCSRNLLKNKTKRFLGELYLTFSSSLQNLWRRFSRLMEGLL